MKTEAEAISWTVSGPAQSNSNVEMSLQIIANLTLRRLKCQLILWLAPEPPRRHTNLPRNVLAILFILAIWKQFPPGFGKGLLILV